jgi:hypothetical protein
MLHNVNGKCGESQIYDRKAKLALFASETSEIKFGANVCIGIIFSSEDAVEKNPTSYRLLKYRSLIYRSGAVPASDRAKYVPLR